MATSMSSLAAWHVVSRRSSPATMVSEPSVGSRHARDLLFYQCRSPKGWSSAYPSKTKSRGVQESGLTKSLRVEHSLRSRSSKVDIERIHRRPRLRGDLE